MLWQIEGSNLEKLSALLSNLFFHGLWLRRAHIISIRHKLSFAFCDIPVCC